jgi:hypothetical protein
LLPLDGGEIGGADGMVIFAVVAGMRLQCATPCATLLFLRSFYTCRRTSVSPRWPMAFFLDLGSADPWKCIGSMIPMLVAS